MALQKRPKTFNEVFKSAYKMSSTESCGLFAPKWHCLWQTLDPAAKILWPEYATAIKTHPAEFDYIQARIKQLSTKKKKERLECTRMTNHHYRLSADPCFLHLRKHRGNHPAKQTDRQTHIHIYIYTQASMHTSGSFGWCGALIQGAGFWLWSCMDSST